MHCTQVSPMNCFGNMHCQIYKLHKMVFERLHQNILKKTYIKNGLAVEENRKWYLNLSFIRCFLEECPIGVRQNFWVLSSRCLTLMCRSHLANTIRLIYRYETKESCCGGCKNTTNLLSKNLLVPGSPHLSRDEGNGPLPTFIKYGQKAQQE